MVPRAAAPSLPAAVSAVAAALLAAGAALLGQAHGWRQGALRPVGAGLGLALRHAASGFAAAFRRLLADGRGAGLRAQMLMLGVGAALASGCDISAYFSGIASGSLHGWVWIVPASAGNRIGLRLRPLFGLDDRGGRAGPGGRGPLAAGASR